LRKCYDCDVELKDNECSIDLCNKCWSKYFSKCEYCGCYHHREDAKYLNGVCICESCLEFLSEINYLEDFLEKLC